MLFNTAVTILDWFGVVVFAVSGALVASRKRMDVVGFALLGGVTGVGGGTSRDVLLGELPVFRVREPAYLIACVAVSAVVFLTAHIPQSRHRLLLWCDALGLSLFVVTGAERALLAGSGPVIAVATCVITATFGCIVRDVLGSETCSGPRARLSSAVRSRSPPRCSERWLWLAGLSSCRGRSRSG